MRSRVLTVLGPLVVLAVACDAPPIPDDSGASQGNANTAKKKSSSGANGPDSNNANNNDPGGDGDPFGDDSSDPSGGNPKKNGGGGGSGGGGGGGTTNCPSTTSQAACLKCCDDTNPKAVLFLNAQYETCACQSPGACATQCAASLCAGKTPQSGDACDTCLSGQQDTCGNQAADACAADATCAQILACSQDAQCLAKP